MLFPAAQSVIYKTKLAAGPNRTFGIFAPLGFLAAVTSRIPDRGEHLVRAYGYCSSVRRGRGRWQVKVAPDSVLLADDAPHAKVARASWASFIEMVFAADPLECPDCGGAMRIVAFIEETRRARHPRAPVAVGRGPAAAGHVGRDAATPRAPAELEDLPWVE